MGKNKIVEDTISENEYTIRMQSMSTKPEDDSPGDSESDAGAEFEMGLEYMPDESNDSELPIEGLLLHPVKKIPETASILSSEQPAPWMDRNSTSSTY